MATDPQQLLMALAGSTGLGQSIADNEQNQALAQQQAGQQLVLGQQQIAQNVAAQQSAQQFSQDVLDYNQDPTPQKLSSLAMRYPAQAQNFATAAKLKDDAQRNADLTSYGQLYNGANNGRADLVQQQLQQRQQAMRAAGQDTTNIDDAIQQLNAAGDDSDKQAAALKNIKGIALAQIYAHDPDGFSKAFSLNDQGDKTHVIGAGGALVSDDGTVLYKGDTKPEYRTVRNADGSESIVQVGGGGGQASTASGAAGGSGSPARRFGWTPRGPNSDAAVDGKIAGMVQALGVDPDAPFPASATNTQIAQALSLSEGGKGSLADRNNNPANLTDAKTGAYRSFPTKAAGIAAAAAQVARDRARGQNSIRTMVEGLPVGGQNNAAPVAGGNGQVVYQSQGNGSAAAANIRAGDISTVPPQTRATVQAIVDGRAAAPRPGSRYGEALLDQVTAFDPTFDASNQPNRMKAVKDFTGQGKGAQVAASGNRLAYHINDLWADSKALAGPDLGWAPLSNLATQGAQAFQQSAVARYNAVLPFISGELQKLTKNGTSTEGETRQIMNNLRPGQPSSVREAAIQQIVDLAQGQFKPFRDSWSSVFPNRAPPVDFTPTTQKIFDRISQGQGPLQVDHNGNEVGAAPAQQFTHRSGSGKFGYIPGRGWVPTQ